MKARLPVGNGLLVDGRRFDTKEQALDNGRGWYVEEQCIPKGPTYSKTYGGELFKIPISESRCKEIKEGFSSNSEKAMSKKIDLSTYLLLLATVLVFGRVICGRGFGG